MYLCISDQNQSGGIFFLFLLFFRFVFFKLSTARIKIKKTHCNTVHLSWRSPPVRLAFTTFESTPSVHDDDDDDARSKWKKAFFSAGFDEVSLTLFIDSWRHVVLVSTTIHKNNSLFTTGVTERIHPVRSTVPKPNLSSILKYLRLFVMENSFVQSALRVDKQAFSFGKEKYF